MGRIEQSVTKLRSNFILRFSINQNSSTMKTKTLIMVCLLLGIGLTQLSAQKGAIKGEFTQTFDGYYLECTGDYLYGDLFCTSILSTNTFIVKIRDCEIIGQPSGKHYVVTVTNTNREDWINPNWEQSMQWWCEGKLVATAKMLSRLKTNANGDVTVDFFHYSFECK